jgi:selenocysteine lyase/cysteine desulfurase
MSNLISQDRINELFPTLSEMTYLNNASTGIPPNRTIEAMKKYLDKRVKVIGDFEESIKMMTDIRENLAKLLGGTRNNYAFVPNTSTGLNTFANGISYPPGSNVVICDQEFPANYVPWQNISRLYDVELRVVKCENGAADVERYKEQIDENTRVVAVSQVQFATGYRVDMRALADAVHEVGGFLVSDIIQAAGCIDTNLVELDVDFAAGQAAKWLVGPIGAGYVYANEHALNELTPRFLGWWGVQDFREFGYTERKPFEDAKKVQVGSPSMIAYVGFHESLKVLLEFSGEARESTALDAANYLRKRLSEKGVGYYEFDDKNRSAIVSCTPPKVEELEKELKKERIFCSVRNKRLRVSPHFYNSREEIDRIVKYLG